MGGKIFSRFLYVAVVLIAASVSNHQARGADYPPTPRAHYYGDADGNANINLSDIAQHRAYTSFKPCTYDTLQPQASGQYWNTCDVDGNRSCNLSDIATLNSYMAFKPVNIGGDPWALENVNLPLTGNPPNEWIPFNINLYMTYIGAPSGRPGISVIAEIDPMSLGHGQLSGRSCTPVAGTRDQLSEPGAQCALAVTITDWQAGQEGLGLTESDTYGFQVWGDGDGDLKIDFRIEQWSAMDVPSVTLSQTVSFTPAWTVWYVDDSATGANDGSSWADAFNSIQDGVDAASAGGQVWVAEGVYSTGTATPVLTMKSGVEVYGGFAGTESDLSERGYPPDYPTIMDGMGISTSIVASSSDSVLDGFYVQNGLTGINNTGTTGVTIRNCTVRMCSGGVVNFLATSSLINCYFEGNTTSSLGGAVRNTASTVDIVNCVFSGNSASIQGGAVYSQSSTLAITNCTFSGNSAQYGGAISNYNTSPVITNSILWGDTASVSGTEIYNEGSSSPVVSYSDVMFGHAGTGNIDADPLFVGYPGLRLQESSPCIDSGAAAGAPAEDIAGLTRPQGSGYDMGAYEYIPLVECQDGIDNDGDTFADWPSDPGCTDLSDTSERGAAACDDGIDNDGDTLIDLADPICQGDPAGLTEAESCRDGIDNDGDTFTDWPSDPGCTDLSDNDERGTAACDDGVDNDGDTLTDLADPACQGNPAGASEAESCRDGLDNDGDTFTDWPSDPGCTDLSDNDERGTAACDDGIDNDGDTLIDLADPICQGNPAGLTEAESCRDGLDNDGDTLTDYPNDPGCCSVVDNDETDVVECKDKIDNDGDGFTDWKEDPGCSSQKDMCEIGNVACDDGIDNDGDGKIDMNDPGCSDPLDTTESDITDCNDGIDNDGDTLTDFPADPGCTDLADTSEYLGTACDDSLDNDGDTLTDFPADPGCTEVADASEYLGTACDDSIDNDGDTYIDWPADPECMSISDVSELSVWFVDDTAPGPVFDGTSWLTAFHTVQEGVDAAVPGDSVWVAEGTYPELVTMKDGVDMFGGFAGTENSFDQRPPVPDTNPSVLDGENTHQIVYGASSIVLDGFVLINGNAPFLSGLSGGAMFNENISDIQVSNCRFEYNTSSGNGGAMCNENVSNIQISNCLFNNNSTPYGGSTIYNLDVTGMSISNSRILMENTAGLAGGGISNWDSTLTITDSDVICGQGRAIYNTGTLWINRSVVNGHAESGGGGIYTTGYVYLDSCELVSGTSPWYGGAVYVEPGAYLNATNTTFSGGSSDMAGGAVYGSGSYTNCTFYQNYGGYMGGAVFSNTAYFFGGIASVFRNCLFYDNSADSGGAYYGIKSLFMNCTITSNSASEYAGGIYDNGGSTITNTILWGNTAATSNDLYVLGTSPIITYSDVGGGFAGEGNFDSDPLFVSPLNFQLSSSSPCIDAGTPISAPASDIEGNPRPIGSGYDVGAYEAPETFNCDFVPVGAVNLPADDSYHSGEGIEWWYWTGHLKTATGRWFGFEHVFFAVYYDGGLFKVRYKTAHHAITDIETGQFHYYASSFVSGSWTYVPNGFNFALGPLTAVGGDGHDVLHGQVDNYVLDLTLDSVKAPVLQFGDGYENFPQIGMYTYYYSREKMDTTGTISIDGVPLPVTGSTWFDHQWGSLGSSDVGWDWFAIKLDDNREMMLYTMYTPSGPALRGSYTDQDCVTSVIDPADLTITPLGTWQSPHSGTVYPAGWNITINNICRGTCTSLHLTVMPAMDDQELTFNSPMGTISYWEGAATVSGDATGRAYVELNPYGNIGCSVSSAPGQPLAGLLPWFFLLMGLYLMRIVFRRRARKLVINRRSI